MREHRDPRKMEELVNQQCARWEARNKMSQGSRSEEIHRPVLILSGNVGTGVRTVAKRLAAELNMDLFAEEIIHAIAQEAHLSDRVIRTMDERGWSYAQEIVKRVDGENGISSEAYFHHLVHVIVAIGRQGNGVVVGHGAAYVLRAPMNLRVRMIAPVEMRTERICGEFGISEEEAHRRIKILDKERADFVRQYFEADSDDVRHFDMVINNEFMDTDVIVGIVADAFMRKRMDWAEQVSGAEHDLTLGFG